MDLDGISKLWQEGKRRQSFCLALILESEGSEDAGLFLGLPYAALRWKFRACFPGAASFPTALGGEAGKAWLEGRREERGRGRRSPNFPQVLSMCEVVPPLSRNTLMVAEVLQ